MKTRKVVIRMGIKTNASLKSLKNANNWYHTDEGNIFIIVDQIQVNVVKEVKR